MAPSHLEEAFAAQWLVSYPLLPFVREHALDAWVSWAHWQKQEGLKARRPPPFRADFAWPDAAVALEIQGGIWRPGGHSTGNGITRDCTKSALAQLSGWALISFTETHLYDANPNWLQLLSDLILFRRNRGLTDCGGLGPEQHQHVGEGSQAAEPAGLPQQRQRRRRTTRKRPRLDLRNALGDARRGRPEPPPGP